MDQERVTLGYWNIRGLAERIRHLLEYLDIPYKQQKFQGNEGRNKWYNEIKPQLIDKNPALTLPYLIDKEKVITEADGICTYLCIKSGKTQLLGRNCDEEIDIATAQGIYKDFYPSYIKLAYGNYSKDYTFDDALKDSVDRFSNYFVKLNGVLGDKEYIAGNITWIDFVLADMIQTLTQLHASYFQKFPKLLEYYKRVWALEKLQRYFTSEEFKLRPYNNYTANWK